MLSPPAAIPRATPSERNVVRPRAQGIAVTLLVAGVTSMLFVPAGPLTNCGVWAFEGPAQTYLLLVPVVLAGLALLVRFPKCSAVAPALALGAALPMLGAAVASWGGVLQGSCPSTDSQAALLVVASAGAFAVASCSAWLLYSRDEIEPWYGARGVVLSGICGSLTIALGAGLAFVVMGGEGEAASGALFVSGPLIWGAVVALCGWLRHPPAVALAACSILQLIWLLMR